LAVGCSWAMAASLTQLPQRQLQAWETCRNEESGNTPTHYLPTGPSNGELDDATTEPRNHHTAIGPLTEKRFADVDHHISFEAEGPSEQRRRERREGMDSEWSQQAAREEIPRCRRLEHGMGQDKDSTRCSSLPLALDVGGINRR
jgi:hypothetical protein